MRKGVNRVALRLFEHNERAYHAAVWMMEQEYKKQYGNLEIPAKYKTADGIWLSRWVYNQKQLLQSGSEKLSEEQKKKLKELLGYYVKISA